MFRYGHGNKELNGNGEMKLNRENESKWAKDENKLWEDRLGETVWKQGWGNNNKEVGNQIRRNVVTEMTK